MPALEITITGLVLAKNSFSESDVFLDLLTEPLGRITATSRGALFLKSRLRYSLEPYSLFTGVIIPTRSSGWQLINAELITNLYYDFKDSKAGNVGESDQNGEKVSNKNLRQKIIIRLIELIRRVVPPDEELPWAAELLGILEARPTYVADNYLLIAIFILIDLGYLNSRLLSTDLSKLEASLEISSLSQGLKGFTDTNVAVLEKNDPKVILLLKNTIINALRNSQL